MCIQRHDGAVDSKRVGLHGIVHVDTLTDNRAARKRLGAIKMRTAACLAIGMVVLCGTARAATQEQIGSWVLSCPGDTPGAEPCAMRINKRFLDQGGITGDLEIQSPGKSLMPVIALRGLSTEMMMAASLTVKTVASLQFGGGQREDLNCAGSSDGYICSPGDAGGQRLAAGLPLARSVTVRISISMPGVNPLPVQEKTLDMSGTNAALAKLRMVGPSQVPGPMTALASQSPEGMMGMADKLLKAAGYPNGTAQIQAMMAKYMKGSK